MCPFFQKEETMTVNEAITTCCDLKPSQYDDVHMLRWLSDVEQKLIDDIFSRHEGMEVIFERYTENSMEEELLAPDPYSELYVHYLMSQIDYYNNEIGRYQNTAAMYNQKWKEFADYWNRTHKSTGIVTMY